MPLIKFQKNPIKTPLFIVALLLLSATYSLYAAETQSENIEIVVENPFVKADVEHGQLLVNGYDAEHFIFPIKIIYINGWQIDDSVKSSDFLLAAGHYDIIVEPDFSNVEPQKIFMGAPWDEKHISFDIKKDQQIVITSRITNRNELQWSVEIYLVEMPNSTVITKQ